MIKNAIWLFIISAVIAVSFFPAYMSLRDLREKNAQYSRDLEARKKEYKALVEEKRKLENDPVYLEKVGREKMGLAREGEVVYKIVPSEGKPTIKGFKD